MACGTDTPASAMFLTKHFSLARASETTTVSAAARSLAVDLARRSETVTVSARPRTYVICLSTWSVTVIVSTRSNSNASSIGACNLELADVFCSTLVVSSPPCS